MSFHVFICYLYTSFMKQLFAHDLSEMFALFKYCLAFRVIYIFQILLPCGIYGFQIIVFHSWELIFPCSYSCFAGQKILILKSSLSFKKNFSRFQQRLMFQFYNNFLSFFLFQGCICYEETLKYSSVRQTWSWHTKRKVIFSHLQI